MTRTLILFGAGPGIGNHVAAEFASKGLTHIILLARNTHRLENEDAPFITKASPGVIVSTLPIDLADLSSLPAVLSKLDDLTAGEDVEVIFFNAARIKPSEVLDVSVAEIDEDFKTTTLSLYAISQHFLPKLQDRASNSALKPALLVTSSHLPWDPVPQLVSLSLVKAAQRTMVIALNRAFGDKGVHVGVVSVEGQVGVENRVLNPKAIAERAVKFWEGGVEAGIEVKIAEEEQ
ncbi:NAD(P)-binding protein [Dothidotthia symphoricarpi CBS 119687]|uniref:NAD(P)-binding protein n=1 Tax=Dothidotthia symphoricarpi CBS 119687 TaxID=1392245 RepID=A0A6A6A930_9PLEO|nr:NAD(P)-binding protein [Dothidotthia symphoricarpi CBS 119687]KAF2128472.1 NAD(P)-binding protein [Dothidotthia symphoricarpi CBS 119687]